MLSYGHLKNTTSHLATTRCQSGGGAHEFYDVMYELGTELPQTICVYSHILCTITYFYLIFVNVVGVDKF